MLKAGLYIVATPIGNLGDLSPRGKEVLKEADIIAAEDTRVSKKLFGLLGITTNKLFIPYEDHSEQQKFQNIVDFILEGKSIALISDAGSPLISDPGYKLVRECRKQGIFVTTIPGACAVISALQLSGLPTNRFMFAGFIPNKDKARIDFLIELKNINTTLVLYETALRLEKTLFAINEVMPEREIAVVREITKIYEETLWGTIQDVIAQVKNKSIKGEIVLLIAPSQKQETALSEDELEELLKRTLSKLSLKETVKTIAETYNLKKNYVYEKALKIKNSSL
jgi:16S rRNA (cytidine1402-2'-O)-methyltransferase